MEAKAKELDENQETYFPLISSYFEDLKPRVEVVIDGENVNLSSKLETLYTFISLDTDPIRRTALIERAMALSAPEIDFKNLPKTEQPVMAQAPQGQKRSNINNQGELGQQTI
jgi:hypothetical protein